VTTLDALRALLKRHPMIRLDGGATPFGVTVYTDHGARHFYGATIDAAIMQAESGTRGERGEGNEEYGT
jgi:hypothetical protein